MQKHTMSPLFLISLRARISRHETTYGTKSGLRCRPRLVSDIETGNTVLI